MPWSHAAFWPALSAYAPYFRMARRPLRAVLVALIGWALFIGAVALSFAVLSLAWEAVESVFLSTGLSGGVRELVSGVLVALLFGPSVCAALFCAGSFRGSLRTLDARVTALNCNRREVSEARFDRRPLINSAAVGPLVSRK